MRTQTNQLQADSSFATYWWKIYLTDDQKVPEMCGYSKFIGHEERQNKVALLKVKIEMLRKHGYITKKSKRIDIYKRAGGLIQKDSDPLILILYPDSFQFSDVLSAEYKACSRYLTILYEEIKGIAVKPLENLNFQRSEVKKDDIVNPNKRINDFRDLESLMNECSRMLSSGYAPDQVNNFYKIIIEKRPNLK